MKTIIKLLTALALCLPTQLNSRTVAPFCDGWQFHKGTAGSDSTESQITAHAAGWEQVTLPHTWNATDMQRAQNQFYQGKGYYQRHFRPTAEQAGKRLFLRFEGVGSVAEVYVNHRLAGTHRGAYSAFTVEIGSLLRWGEDNLITVVADNTARPDVIPINHVLFGVYGGIYRPVWLVQTERTAIAVDDLASQGIYVRQQNVSTVSADVEVRVKVSNITGKRQPLRLSTAIYDRQGRLCTETACNAEAAAQGLTQLALPMKVMKPHLWQGRDDPYLYRVVTRLQVGGQTVDSLTTPLGLRRVELVAGKGVFLNGKRYPMYGVTRHQDYWGKGSALSNADHDRDLKLIMEVGATTIRLAHYQQSDYFYSRCDSLGLLVWAEIPFVNRVSCQERDNAWQQLRELIRQNYNHPSIYIWGLHNEVYRPHDYTAQLTAELNDLAKTEDPDRYTVSTNGYGWMTHPVNLRAEVQAMNRYFGWYEGKVDDFGPWIDSVETRHPDLRFMLSEYGADGNIRQQTEYLGESNDWTKPWYPETFETLVHERQWAVIRQHPYILASYLWNMFDFATPAANRGGVPARNMKGLVTFDRQTKKDAFYFYKASWSHEPVLYITQRRNTERERRQTSVTVYSNQGMPTLWLNGKKLSQPRQGLTPVIWTWDNVILRKGKNTLKTAVNRSFKDQIVWNYERESNRGQQAEESKRQHGGL